MSDKNIYSSTYRPWSVEIPEQAAPVDAWGNDFLGDGFYSRTIPLADDEEGPQCATIIRYSPESDAQAIPNQTNLDAPRFTFLYIHGWHDYYFQREMARHVALAGGAFYAVDLRKYGRSLKVWQTPGWTPDIRVYDEEIRLCREIIEFEHPGLPFVISGHSTGGLTASYWAKRYPAEVAGVVLNSPWLEMPGGAKQRAFIANLAGVASKKLSKSVLPGQDADSLYAECIALGWTHQDGQLPSELEQWRGDPSIQGWPINRCWKGTVEFKLRFGWIHGITLAQKHTMELPQINAPVFMATAEYSNLNVGKPEVHHCDSVLNVQTMCESAWNLSTRMSMYKFHGMHDLLLSYPPTRMEFWDSFHHWAHSLFTSDIPGLSTEYRRAICP